MLPTRISILLMRPTLIIAGPTASGKSSLAIRIAKRVDGEIINADSMQVYKYVPILTAQPSADEMAQVPHHLYSVLEPDDPCSAGRWRDMAEKKIAEVLARDKTPIVVGGTGLYIKALTDGLAVIPTIDPQVREQAKQLYDLIGAEEFYKLLKARDPETARTLKAADKQRMIRAIEVLEGTGRPLIRWQEGTHEPDDRDYVKLLVMPERESLYEIINARFLAMMQAGAVKEVKDLLAKGYDEDVGGMKAVGVSQITAFLRGTMTEEEAVSKSQQATRNYAKRQYTWFRGQYGPLHTITDTQQCNLDDLKL